MLCMEGEQPAESAGVETVGAASSQGEGNLAKSQHWLHVVQGSLSTTLSEEQRVEFVYESGRRCGRWVEGQASRCRSRMALGKLMPLRAGDSSVLSGRCPDVPNCLVQVIAGLALLATGCSTWLYLRTRELYRGVTFAAVHQHDQAIDRAPHLELDRQQRDY